MGLLVKLVTDRVFGSRGTGAEGGIRVLSNLLLAVEEAWEVAPWTDSET